MAKELGLHSWRELALGAAILKPGSASELKTGDWRSSRPVVDYEKCVKCGRCYILCPDMVYSLKEDGYYELNYYYCKGCGICAHECPKDAIEMIEEGS
ncbi:MAG: 4Fe-4S binding protein [Thermodesulforhabdaceae bacterium]